jgi:glycosyltransferase involved in cell wall biosynthesis
VRVLVEPEAFRYGRCGTARYYSAVCRGLAAAGVEVDLPLVASGTDYQRGLFRLDAARGPFTERLSWWAGRLSRRLFLRRAARGRHDVVLLTSSRHETDFLERAPATKFLLVCHDTMRSVPIPGGAIDAWADPLHRLLYLARRAARVVCVSEATRRDLLASAPLDPSRVSVVPTGNLLPLWATSGAAVPGLPERYLLFVGSRQVRKNFVGTMRALAPLLERTGGPSLVCTGRLDAFEVDLLESLGLDRAVLGVDASDATLVTLYERALGLVFPSFYEGFGLPVLEAMALGCPVVTSSTSSLPEVAGDAALLVDPCDPAALLLAATRLVDEPDLRARLSEAGRRRAALFTFESMMSRFLDELRLAAA